MKREKLILELPHFSDEGAATVHKFFETLMYTIDDHYYKQVYQYHANKLANIVSEEATYPYETLDQDPPF